MNTTTTRHCQKKPSISVARLSFLRGFTLLELLVVIVIIGLLVGYVAPNYFGAISKSEDKVARAQIDSLQKALIAYRLDVGDFPTTEMGLSALYNKPSGVARWSGPYLSKSAPVDPWGHQYSYRHPGQHGDFDLTSFGRDGRPGGTGAEADITN